MAFLDIVRSEVSSIFLKDFAEDIQYDGSTYKALIDLSSEPEGFGREVKDAAVIHSTVKIPYGSIIVASDRNWLVERVEERTGIYVHYCRDRERVNYG